MEERLQKLIARAGVASRRHAEELIRAGRVTVNGQVVTQLGSKADAERDHVKVNGKLLRFPEAKIYVALYKPSGCVATMSDPEGRPTLAEHLRGVPGRVFPVGRLGYHAEGLVLLTNDGALANRLLKISGRLPQIYWIKVKGPLSGDEMRGVQQQAGARLELLKGQTSAANPWYEATFTEARSNALRQALARLGHPVEKLRRVSLWGVDLGTLTSGEYRMLTAPEVAALRRTPERGPRPVAGAEPQRGIRKKKVHSKPQRKERQQRTHVG